MARARRAHSAAKTSACRRNNCDRVAADGSMARSLAGFPEAEAALEAEARPQAAPSRSDADPGARAPRGDAKPSGSVRGGARGDRRLRQVTGALAAACTGRARRDREGRRWPLAGERRRSRANWASLPERANLVPQCTRVISHPLRRFRGVPGTISRAGERARAISFRSSHCAPCARSKAASSRRRSRIITRLIRAITMRSASDRSVRSVETVIRVFGRSTGAAIATRSATMACRSIPRIRSIGGGGRPRRCQPIASARRPRRRWASMN
jgi:hypothetical protein